MYPRSLPAQFLYVQSGVDFKLSLSNLNPLNTLTRLIGLWQGLLSGTKDLKSLVILIST
jgi:hypothetical protein